MKKIISAICLLLCFTILCSCELQGNYNDIEDTNEASVSAVASSEPPSCDELGHDYNKKGICKRCGFEGSCDEVGHNYKKGVCTRCGNIKEVNIRKRISLPESVGFQLNSADGIEAYWCAKNISGKTIKYCILDIHFYNRVDDPVYDEITKKDHCRLRITGPIEPYGTLDFDYDTVLGYNPACSAVSIDNIELEYMDGKKETGWYGRKWPAQ